MGIKDFFSRLSRKDDIVVDLADLQKKGIFKPGKSKESSSSDSIVDLTSSKPYSNSSSDDGSSALSFLGALASASSSDNGITEISSSSATYVSSTQKQNLREILKEMKDKIDTDSRKIYKLFERIEFLERKIERLEGRAGL